MHTKKEGHGADYTLLMYFGILVVFGLIALSSASVAVGVEYFNDPNHFIKRQALYAGVGLLAFLFTCKVPYTKWQAYARHIFFGTLLVLGLTLIPGIGATFDTGARSWIPILGFSFQPSEVAKLSLIIFLAAFMSEKGRELTDLKSGFLVSLGLGMAIIGLVLIQPDVGTASILFGILFALLFIGGAQLKHLGTLFILGFAGFATMIAIAPYRARRFMTFLHPELDPLGIGYHINQAFLAIGSGGMFGLGLGHSRQKFAYLPEVHADSIFAILAEEMGFIIAAGLVLFIVVIALRGLKVAKHAPDSFARILVAGIITWFLVQSFLNIGAMVGLLPLTGVPLPFVSHGGTALIVAMAAAGIVINVSRYTTREKLN